MLVDLKPDKALQDQWIVRDPADMECQCAPTMSEHQTNTERIVLNSQGMLHLEGGWPKDVDASEIENKVRYRKKVEKNEKYQKAVKDLAKPIEHCIKQNSAIDIYEDYFADSFVDHSGEIPSAKTVAVFRDPSPIKRTAAHISWFPTDGKKLAVAYCILQFQQMPEGMNMNSYIWDVNNPNVPEMELVPSSPLCCLEYNPKDTHVLVGGCYNGLLSWWDTRRGPLPTETSQIEMSHRDPVYDVKWLQSKTGSECMSVSTDGQVLFWDTRKLSEVLSMPLETNPGGGLLGGVSIDYNPNAAGPSKFMVGTEQGIVLSCNKKGKNDRMAQSYAGHHGPVYACQRSVHYPKYFLTIGDWTARIWNEDIKTPIMTTKYHSSYLTDGCWSPTRPGVFMTTKMDGTLDVWDYLYKQNSPVLTVQVADSGLHCMRVYDGKQLAVGAVDGSTSLLELSEGLARPQQNEKNLIGMILDRESAREKNLQLKSKKNNSSSISSNSNNRGGQDSKKGSAMKKNYMDENQIRALTDEFFRYVAESEESGERSSGSGSGSGN